MRPALLTGVSRCCCSSAWERRSPSAACSRRRAASIFEKAPGARTPQRYFAACSSRRPGDGRRAARSCVQPSGDAAIPSPPRRGTALPRLARLEATAIVALLGAVGAACSSRSTGYRPPSNEEVCDEGRALSCGTNVEGDTDEEVVANVQQQSRRPSRHGRQVLDGSDPGNGARALGLDRPRSGRNLIAS